MSAIEIAFLNQCAGREEDSRFWSQERPRLPPAAPYK